jgi:secreted trypsin-like serine protease
VGYGRRGNTTGAGVRERRANVPVLAVTAHEFEIGQGTCSGDSGGPALDTAGAVVGVVSRGNPDCSSGDAQNVYSRVDVWASLVRQGIQLGGG